MALIQTRRTVSLGRSVYELAKDHVASINEKLCPWVEQLVIAELRRHGVKIQKHERAKRAEVDRACVAGRKVHRWRKIDDRVVECIHCCARGVVY